MYDVKYDYYENVEINKFNIMQWSKNIPYIWYK